MSEVGIRFEREDREGVVAVGTYIADAMRRMGITLEETCGLEAPEHFCLVTVTSGADKLSPLTETENTYFARNGRKSNERLACQAKFEKGGEVTIMTRDKKKDEDAKAEDKNEEYRKQFAELPLEQKIASLVHLEALTLGETVSFVINSPFKIFEKAMDVMAEFGFKLEKDAKEATRPKEHRAAKPETEENGAATDAGKSKKAKNGGKATS